MVVPHSQHSEAGTVKIDAGACKQCGQCAAICPADVLLTENGQVRVSAESPFGCIACGHCMMVCPEESISVTGRGLSPSDLFSNVPCDAISWKVIASVHSRPVATAGPSDSDGFSVLTIHVLRISLLTSDVAAFDGPFDHATHSPFAQADRADCSPWRGTPVCCPS